MRKIKSKKAHMRYSVFGVAGLGLLLGSTVMTPVVAHATEEAVAIQEIVVTGSRITRKGFSAPTPVSTVTNEDLAKAGVTNVGVYLANLPSFVPTSSPQSSGNIDAGAGSSFLNLRGLGIQRTLVLVNGERHVATNAAGVVDINILPSIAVERVDVVTGGASAAWGSDAVSGVVNLISADKMTGLKLEAQAGVSQYGDGEDYRLAAMGGTSFANGRGHVMVAGEYQRNQGIRTPNGRDWAEEGWAIINNPAASSGGSSALVRPGVQQSIATANGLIRGPSAIAGYEFAAGGTLKPFTYGTLNNGSYMVGGGGMNIVDVLSVPYDRKTAYLSTSYDLTENTSVYFRGSFGRSHAVNPIQPNYANSLTIRSDNAYLAASTKALLAANNITSFTVGRIFTDLGMITNDNTATTYDATLGVNGRLGADWTWNAYYKSGSTQLNQRKSNVTITPNLTAALDAVVNTSGQIVCRSTLTGATPVAGAMSGCAPVNIFGSGAITQAAKNYITGTAMADINVEQEIFSASAQGSVFSLPAGEVNLAVGAEYREESVKNVADALSNQGGGFTFPYAASFSGADNVKEAFAEIAVPVLKDLKFARALDLNGAVRYTDYKLAGGVTTWKYGSTWRPFSTVLVRATQSRDIRAPNLTELFTTVTMGYATPVDPCTAASQAANATIRANCAAAGLPANFGGTSGVVAIQSGGNSALTPEKAKTKTVGVVFSPSGSWGALNVSVDWYSINIDDRIGTLTTAALLANCYASSVGCSAITRGADGQITTISVQQMNIAKSLQEGIDFEAVYRVTPRDIGLPLDGRLEARVSGTHIYRIDLSADGVTTREAAGDVGQGDGGAPKWKFNTSLTYNQGPLTLFGQARYIGGGYIYYKPETKIIDDSSVEDVTLFDVSGSYRFEKIEAFGGINNLLNTDPPRAVKSGSIPLYTNAALYETTGRYFYAGVRMKF